MSDIAILGIATLATLSLHIMLHEWHCHYTYYYMSDIAITHNATWATLPLQIMLHKGNCQYT